MFTDATCYESYADNANREMCSSNGIQTFFVQKGKRVKEHFFLRRNKAGKTETLYFSIDIHTSNVVQLMDRPMEQQLAEAA